MDKGLPKVLILGLSQFVAENLVWNLLESGLAVVGVGEYIKGLEGEENFLYLSDESEISYEFDYGFDFSGQRNDWERWLKDNGKLTLVLVNETVGSDRMREWYDIKKLNWRIVEAYGVYGPGMGGMGFLAEAFSRAVDNESLILPNRDKKFRLLAVEDVVEAIKRACFLSGTAGESFLVVGGETNSEEVAETLINEAKMTKVSVLERAIEVDEWEETEVAENWKKLRWKPEIKFEKGIEETLQYFFTVKDELNRKGKNFKVGVAYMRPVQREEEAVVDKRFESVVVENVEERISLASARDDVLKNESTMSDVLKENINSDYVLPGAKRIVPHKFGTDVLKRVKKVKKEMVIPKLGRIIPRELGTDVLKRVDSVSAEPKVFKFSVKIPKIKIKWPKISIKIFGRGNLARTLATGLVLGLLIGAVWWPVTWVKFGMKIKSEVVAVTNLIVEGKYDEAAERASQLSVQSKKYSNQIDSWGLNKIPIVRNFQSILRVADDVYVMEEKMVGLAKVGEEVAEGIFNEKEVDWEKSLKEMEARLVELELDLGRVEARLKGDWSFLPTGLAVWPQKLTSEVAVVKEKIVLLRKAMMFLPDFLGTDGKRRDYMVLLQNESELRAGGGFIGSYAMLSFEDGALLNFEVKDIYEADGQLKGHVEPPEPIRRFLGEAAWYMRDSNWRADFTEATKDITWFLEKETGRSVDGVIGVNMALAKAMLEVTGELYVPDFEEKINAANLYEQAEFYSETKFFPGSKQKASFLGGVSRQLFEEIRNLNNEKRVRVVEKILELLEQNEIQLVLNYPNSALVLDDLGWSGKIYAGKCKEERCMADYLYAVESNVGVNKANYFLYRNMELEIKVGEQSIERILKINYENTAKNSNWPGGDYKNYIRVYLPSDVNLSSVAVSDPRDPTKTKIYSSGEDLSISEVMGKKELGFLVTVPVMSKRVVEIRYGSKVNLPLGEQFSYLNYIQKQAGLGDTGLVVLVSFPDGWLPMQVEPAASLVSGKLLFNMKLNKDVRMGVEIGK